MAIGGTSKGYMAGHQFVIGRIVATGLGNAKKFATFLCGLRK